MIKFSKLRQNQEGLAAILVTILLMLVITLISLSFARIARQEQRQTLDRNLSSRAFYAAESGINMAAEAIGLNPNNYVNGKDTCATPDSVFVAADYDLDASSETKVACLLIDRTPNTIDYQGVNNKSKVFPLYSADSSQLGKVFFNWQSTTAPSSNPNFGSCPSSGQFPATWPGNCDAPVLRVDLVPTDGNTLSRGALSDTTFSAFIFPGTLNQEQNFSANIGGNQGVVFTAFCNGITTPDKPYYCQGSVAGLTGSKYFVRLQSLYGSSNVVIAAGANSSTKIPLIGAQIIIDSTGRAQDIVRRIQVRKPIAQNSNVPEFALIAAAGICKRYSIIPNTSTVVADGLVLRNNAGEPCAID